MSSNTSEDLLQKKCKPCEGGVPPVGRAEAERLLAGLTGWKFVSDGKAIRKEWRAKDFGSAMDFFNRVAHLAEEEEHHPDLHLTGYRNAAIELSTHAIGGLSENDFILAAKINQLPIELKK
jgi:4a-hydroxytetrahydrobiopterin dehydratase